MVAATSTSNIQGLADKLKVLAEPNRLRIFDLLMQGVQCNCELGDALDMAPNLISHHISALKKAGLVDAERDPVDARWVYYSINYDCLHELHTTFEAFFDPARIEPRRPNCGPSNPIVQTTDDAACCR